MNKSVHFVVSGRVQGVFFRIKTKQRAQQLSLSGWVRNLPDGSVEGIASGELDQLGEFQSWLQHGPDMAHVVGVKFEEIADQNFNDFSIR